MLRCTTWIPSRNGRHVAQLLVCCWQAAPFRGGLSCPTQAHAPVASSTFTLLCNRHHHPSPEHFSSSQTDTLPPLNSLSIPLPQPLETTILLSVFMIFTTLGPHISGIIQYLSLCGWPILLSIMSSMFIYIVVHVRISFLVQVE